MKKKDWKKKYYGIPLWIFILIVIGLGFYFLAPSWMNGKNVSFEYQWLKTLCDIHPNCEPGTCWTIFEDGELSILPCGEVCHCPPEPIPECYDYPAKCRTECLVNEESSTGGNLGCPKGMFCCGEFPKEALT